MDGTRQPDSPIFPDQDDADGDKGRELLENLPEIAPDETFVFDCGPLLRGTDAAAHAL